MHHLVRITERGDVTESQDHIDLGRAHGERTIYGWSLEHSSAGPTLELVDARGELHVFRQKAEFTCDATREHPSFERR